MTYRKQLIIVVILVCLRLQISALNPEETWVSNTESTPTDRLELMRKIAKYLLELPADIHDDGKISNTLHGVFGEPIQNIEDSRSRLLTNIYTSNHISKQVPQNDFSNGFGLVQPGTNAQGWQYVGLKFGLPAARRRRYFHAAQMANVNFPVRPPTDDLNVNFPYRTPADDQIPAGNGWSQGIQQKSLESLQFLDFNHLLYFNRCTQIANTIIHEKCLSEHCTPPEDQWSDVVQCWLNARKIVLHPEPMVDASVYPDIEADFIPAKQRQYEENLADTPKALGEADFKEYNSVTEEKLKEMTEDVFADGLSANSQSPDKTDLDESALGSWIPKEGNDGQVDIPGGSQQLQYAQEPENIWVAKRTMETGAKYKRFLINSRFMGIHRPRGKREYQGLFDNYSLVKLNPWSISGGRRLGTEQRPILDAAEMSTVPDTSKSAFNKDMLREYNVGPLAPRNYNTEFPSSEVAKEINDQIRGQTKFNPTDNKRAVWRALGGYKVGKKSQTNPRTFTVNYALTDSSTNDLDNNVHFNSWDPLAKQTFG